MLKFRVVHGNQIGHKRYFHDGLKKPFLKPKPVKTGIDKLHRNDSLVPPGMSRAAHSQIIKSQTDADMDPAQGEQKQRGDKGRA